ncbi:MAG: sialate O-acetylesterase [Muribaculaceae bacterium]|nr:sialate O-acetylesterase [Muribaculaceae bacterium]
MKKLLLLSLSLFTLSASAEIELPQIIGDNMVLQQNSDALLWGWATPDSKIQVTTGWNNRTYSTTTGSNGRWNISVPTPEASYTPYDLVVKGDGSDIKINNILIGEVWFCSGQSNMEMPLRGFGSQPVEGATKAIAYSGQNKGIRVATVPKLQSYEPQEKVPGKWKESSPENAPEFSAVAYFFAEALNKIIDKPVGIIVCAYGGSKLESWLPEWKLEEYGPLYDMKKEKGMKDGEIDSWHRVGVEYNAMLKPLIGYTIKGFLWNQGESNVGLHNDYPAHQADMVELWRNEWGNDNLPFYFVEIPGWNYDNPNGTSAALFRESQHKAAEITPNCEFVSTVDLVYPFEVDDIHARQKKPIGERLAFLAATKDYDVKGLPWQYPTFKSVELNGNTATILFSQPNSGLNPYNDMPGFEVAGEDRVFYPAKAREEWDFKDNTFKIYVSAPEVNDIKSVRYAFKNFYPATVRDMLGMPLVPFRTDDWEE